MARRAAPTKAGPRRIYKASKQSPVRCNPRETTVYFSKENNVLHSRLIYKVTFKLFAVQVNLHFNAK